MMNELTCEAIIFDLDGVLIDSGAVVERYWRQWAARHDLDPEEVVRGAHGRRTVDVIRFFAPHLDAEEEAARLVAEEGQDTDGLALVDGAARLVRSVPDGRWAVATSGTHATATTRLNYADLPTPPVLVTAGDVGEGKPAPEAYLRAAALLDVAPARCLVFEDAPAGVAAARAAGMRVVGVPTTYTPAQLSEADAVVTRLADVEITPDGPAETLVVRLDGRREA